MPNIYCNGDFLVVGKKKYYSCFWDRSLFVGLKNGDKCPRCERIIDAVKTIKCKIIQQDMVLLPAGEKIPLIPIMTANANKYKQRDLLNIIRTAYREVSGMHDSGYDEAVGMLATACSVVRKQLVEACADLRKIRNEK